MISEGKARPVIRATTLEAYHQQKMKEFTATTQSVSDIEAELLDLEEKLDLLPDSATFSDEWRQLSDAIEERRKRISEINSDEKRLDYFLDVGGMLFQYFDAQEALAKGDTPGVASAPMRMPTNSVLSYFTEAVEQPSIHDSQQSPAPRAQKQKASDIDSSDGLNRDKMLEKYLSVVEPTAIKGGIMPGSGIEPGWGSCPVCDVEMTFFQNEALLGCPRCGHEEFILVDSEKPSYKDPPREITYFAYKKINHFNEWLAQFQAKESTEIPEDIFQAILEELKKERIVSVEEIKQVKIREILKKLRCTNFYEHVPYILNRINGKTAPVMSREIEEKLRFMFKEIQSSFVKHCPKTRSNFLSYSYVLYKFCELLELDDYLQCFPLLKNRDKLYNQDKIWERICTDLRWQFIRSI
jgi:predicted  nucleic acid-binding Zn-ribbon protein